MKTPTQMGDHSGKTK